MDFFNSRIHSWYSKFKRDLPWRNTSNPYFIWLSEIILQQTRIDQGMAYYFTFVSEFPTISHLANATEDQILKHWQGLGYYSRARNLHFSAKFIERQYNGIFPKDYDKIRSLKGIGEYTAAAIASISFNLEYPAIDGNVYRVLSRFFGISAPIDSSNGKKIFNNLAKELIKGTDAGMHNQAIMEFGAIQCRPNKPDCLICPLIERCYAFSANKIQELPSKRKKAKLRDRYFNYFVFESKGHLWLKKRVGKDIWKNLFEFPLVETIGEPEIGDLFEKEGFLKFALNDQSVIKNISKWKIQTLSHQRIHYRFIRIGLNCEIDLNEDLIKVNKEDINNFAVSKLLETYLDENCRDGLFI